MKSYLKHASTLVILVIIIITTMAFSTKSSTYKCLIQMTNYTGEGAYVVISLIDPKGNYEKTLYVQGKDNEWYHDIKEWWRFYGKKRTNIDAITGATISGGERSMNVIEIEDAKLNTGYSLRFETAVEDKQYYVKDVEIALTTANVKEKHDGTGYIRYVRLLPNN